MQCGPGTGGLSGLQSISSMPDPHSALRTVSTVFTVSELSSSSSSWFWSYTCGRTKSISRKQLSWANGNRARCRVCRERHRPCCCCCCSSPPRPALLPTLQDKHERVSDAPTSNKSPSKHRTKHTTHTRHTKRACSTGRMIVLSLHSHMHCCANLQRLRRCRRC